MASYTEGTRNQVHWMLAHFSISISNPYLQKKQTYLGQIIILRCLQPLAEVEMISFAHTSLWGGGSHALISNSACSVHEISYTSAFACREQARHSHRPASGSCIWVRIHTCHYFVSEYLQFSDPPKNQLKFHIPSWIYAYSLRIYLNFANQVLLWMTIAFQRSNMSSDPLWSLPCMVERTSGCSSSPLPVSAFSCYAVIRNRVSSRDKLW